MSFATDIKYLMTSDTSLNTMSEGGIHYENLPVNFDFTKNGIIYSFNKTSQISCMNGGIALMQYNITAKILSTDPPHLEEINDYLVSYLNNKSYNNIRDVAFASDNHTIDLEKGVYVNILQFDVLYEAY